MNKYFLNIFCFVFIAVSTSCKSNTQIADVLSDTLVFNDSITSSRLIVKDDNDDFFKNLQSIDVAIQMKDNLLLNNPNYISIYKKHLTNQVSNFTKDDKDFLNKVYQKVVTNLKVIKPSLNVDLSVSKIKPDHS